MVDRTGRRSPGRCIALARKGWTCSTGAKAKGLWHGTAGKSCRRTVPSEDQFGLRPRWVAVRHGASGARYPARPCLLIGTTRLPQFSRRAEMGIELGQAMRRSRQLRSRQLRQDRARGPRNLRCSFSTAGCTAAMMLPVWLDPPAARGESGKKGITMVEPDLVGRQASARHAGSAPPPSPSLFRLPLPR